MKSKILYILLIYLFFGLTVTSGIAEQMAYDPETIRIEFKVVQPGKKEKSDLYTIHQDVINRGFVNYYVIDSPFGTFEAAGDAALDKRLNEILAIDTLQKMSKSDVFVKTVGDTVSAQAKSISRAITNPVETVSGIPDGLNRLWKRSKRQVSNAYENVRDVAGQVTESSDEEGGGVDAEKTMTVAKEEGTKYVKQSLGVTSAHRNLARELQVDPYTDNQSLQEELASMARFIAASGYGLGQIMPSTPKELNLVSDVQKMVWDMDSLDLRLLNEKVLAEMGIDETVIKKFLDHKQYSTSQKTQIVQTLKDLGTSVNKRSLLDIFMEAANETESRFYSRWCLFIQSYNKNRNPIKEIQLSRLLPIVVTQNEQILLVLPLDYLSWTETSAKAAERVEKELQQISSKIKSREIWVEGKVSPLAQKALSGLQWQIHEKMFDKISK